MIRTWLSLERPWKVGNRFKTKVIVIYFVLLKRSDSFVKSRLERAKNGSAMMMETPIKVKPLMVNFFFF